MLVLLANKHTIIVIASIVIIAGSVGYSSLNVISAPELQFSWPGNAFNFLSVMTDKTVNVCNNSDLPASFSKYSFTVVYEGKDLGTYSTGHGGFAPHTGGVVYGKFDSLDDRTSSLFFSFFDTEDGGTDVTRIDTGKIKIRTQLDSTVLWIMPYTITHDYSSSAFLQMINEKPACK